MHTLLRFLFPALGLLVTTGVVSGRPMAAGTPKPPVITGIYSDLEYSEEGGDLLGMEVFLVFGGDGYYATVQESEGESGPPVVVPAKVQGAQVRFTLPDKRIFVGTITAKGLKGHFLGDKGSEIFLRRGKSYWQ